MIQNDTERKTDVICRCSGTTETQIRRYVEQGIDDLDEISQATGAVSGCGGCDSDILQLIAEYRSGGGKAD
ncbi:MAG: (2Fe-2S)-binding protein [Methylococcus sp.]